MSEPQKVTFLDCVRESAQNPAFVAGFNRLRGHSLVAETALEQMIDAATGRTDAVCRDFLWFVYEVVWLRLPPDLKRN